MRNDGREGTASSTITTPRGNADEELDPATLLESLRGLSAAPLEVRGADEAGRQHAAAAWTLSRGEWAEGTRLAELAGERAAHLLEWARRQPPP